MLKKLLHGRELSECLLFSLQSSDTSEADLIASYLSHRQPTRSLLLLAGREFLEAVFLVRNYSLRIRTLEMNIRNFGVTQCSAIFSPQDHFKTIL